jgi:hypothetical protein
MRWQNDRFGDLCRDLDRGGVIHRTDALENPLGFCSILRWPLLYLSKFVIRKSKAILGL